MNARRRLVSAVNNVINRNRRRDSIFSIHEIYSLAASQDLYRSLPKPQISKEEIRLIHLLPGQSSDPILCTIETISLSTKPSFEALSYTWRSSGSSHVSPSIPVRVNGIVMFVLPHLALAMQCLRNERDERVIWIDFLCINQADVIERGEQVQQMGDIYESAAQVVIFLGSADKDTEEALQFLEELGQDMHLADHVGNSSISVLERKSMSLNRLLHRDWFSRVWTIQEVVLARHAVLQCTRKTVSWRALEVALQWILRHQVCCASLLQTKQPVLDVCIRLQMLAPRFKSVEAESQDSLRWRLIRGSTQKATDVRDYVFSVLGLLSPTQRLVLPDYCLKPDQVFTKVALEIMKHDRSVEYLAQADDAGKDPSLPSWVPDPSRWTEKGHVLFHYYKYFSCAGPTNTIFEIQSEAVISLKGMFVDTVSAIDVVAWPNSLPRYEDGHKGVTNYR